jgi:NifU-like protein involved in Fe-S cluster formation
MAAVEDAAGAVEVASTDRAAVGAWACSARMVSAASAVELVVLERVLAVLMVLERVLAVLMTLVCHEQECGIQLAAEARVEGPAARAHCTAAAAAAAVSGLGALSQRRRAGLLESRTR